jgi:sugar-specific transcriptional regulator TrmB
MIKLFITSILSLLILFSCKNENLEEVNNNKEKILDTLNFTEFTIITKDTTSNIIKIFKHKTDTKIGRPVNEKINLKLDFKNELKKIAKHSNINLVAVTKKLRIKKIDDFNYEIFIAPNIEDDKIIMNLKMGPKKNYVMKTYWMDSIVRNPSLTEVCQFAEIVYKK